MRFIARLDIKDNCVIKGINFEGLRKVGEPSNLLKKYYEDGADEIIIIDIKATSEKRGINFDLISEIASECFMPLAYGGGITAIEEIKKLFFIGVEKVCINN